MSLMQCPDCDGKVSTQASACPHCGRLVKFHEKQTEDTDFGPCPDLPSDLSIGRMLFDWGGYRFRGYFNTEENVMPKHPSGKVHDFLNNNSGRPVLFKVHVMLHTKGIDISGITRIHYQQIINFNAVKRDVPSQESKSVAGRAVIGGLILGPTGAIVGGLTGLSKAYVGYLVVNYWDSDSRIPQTLLVSGSWPEIYKFCSRLSEQKSSFIT